MSAARRDIRNTVLGLCSAAVLFVGVNRLDAMDVPAPGWLRAALTLGLESSADSGVARTATSGERVYRDFTRLSVSGGLVLEVVGAAEYKVSFPAAAGDAQRVRAQRHGEQLRLSLAAGVANDEVAVRIETPALAEVIATGLRSLTLRGLQDQQVAVDLEDVGAVHLQQNAVAQWRLSSTTPVQVQVDEATLTAGSLQVSGELVIRHARCCTQAVAAPGSPVFFSWNLGSSIGWERSGIYNANSIRAIQGGGARRSRLAYMTGGEAGLLDVGARDAARAQRAPDRLVAESREGEVLVRQWAFEGQGIEDAAGFTRRTARALHAAVTSLWPAMPTAVHADLYVMPDGAAYSLARQVRWQRGEPLQVVILFPRGRAAANRDVATHELFHVLAKIHPGHGSDQGEERPNMASGMEEVAANLFASCGALLADGSLPRPGARRYVVNGVHMEPPLTGQQVKKVLAWMRSLDARPAPDRPGTSLGSMLASTPVFEVFGPDRESIELQSAQGERLLGMCRDFLPDPLQLEPWFEKLV